jgi:hypothetical protein
VHWQRIFKLSGILAATIGLILVAPLFARSAADAFRRYHDSPRPIVATSAETHEIVLAVIEEMKFEGIPPPPPGPGESASPPSRRRTLILSDTSVCTSAEPASDSCDWHLPESLLGPSLDDFAPTKIRAELLAANLKPAHLTLGTISGVSLKSHESIQSVFADDGRWDDFYAAFPGTSGYAEVTLPVLTADRRQALIYIAHHCDGTCGRGTLLLLRRRSSGWHVEKQVMLWIS